MDNGQIADRLEVFAMLLELGGANPYSGRAYRRAAEAIRASPAPIAEMVRSGQVRELRGIGSGIEARLRELLETGEIAELAELERALAPDLLGLARYLGLSAARAVELARALNVRTADEFREAAASGRLRDAPGIGAKREAQLLEALAREAVPRPRRGLLLDHATELVEGIASALGGETAGDVRRRRELCEQLIVVCAADDPAGMRTRFAALPQIVVLLPSSGGRTIGLTVEGVPVELVVAEPKRLGTALLRATGTEPYVSALEPLPEGTDEPAVYRRLALPWCPPELREEPFRGDPPVLVEQRQIRGDLHCHSTWSDGRASIEEMGRAGAQRGYEYLAICDHTPAVGAVKGLSPDDVRRQGEEIAAANLVLAPFRSSGESNATSSPTGALTCPMTSSPSSTGCRPASTAVSACHAGR